jgi:hypothetical protein
MHVHVTHHVVPIMVASAHGLTDLTRPVPHLWPYALVPLVPESVAAPLFLVASIVHFSRDVGRRGSVLLHALWVGLFLIGMEGAAWDTFAAYYCCVHTLRHLVRTPRGHGLAVAAAVATAWVGASLIPPCVVDVGPVLQTLIAAHVVCGELYGD